MRLTAKCQVPNIQLGMSERAKNILLSIGLIAVVSAIGGAGRNLSALVSSRPSVAAALDFGWLFLLPVVAFAIWKPTRKVMISHEFSVLLMLDIAIATLVGTLWTTGGVFAAPWFVSVIGLMGTSSLLCIILNLPARKKVSYLMVHSSILTVLAGSVVTHYTKEEGYIHIYEGETTKHIDVMRNGKVSIVLDDNLRKKKETKELPFSVRMDKFDVEFYEATPMLYFFVKGKDRAVGTLELKKGEQTTVEGVTVKAIGLSEKEVVPVPGHAPVPVQVAQFEANGKATGLFPGKHALVDGLAIMFRMRAGEPKVYQSTLTVLDDSGNEVQTQKVVVNDPLRQDGWWFYQSNWDPKNRRYSGIHVVRDPGLPLVFLGLIILVLGTLAKVRIGRGGEVER